MLPCRSLIYVLAFASVEASLCTTSACQSNLQEYDQGVLLQVGIGLRQDQTTMPEDEPLETAFLPTFLVAGCLLLLIIPIGFLVLPKSVLSTQYIQSSVEMEKTLTDAPARVLTDAPSELVDGVVSNETSCTAPKETVKTADGDEHLLRKFGKGLSPCLPRIPLERIGAFPGFPVDGAVWLWTPFKDYNKGDGAQISGELQVSTDEVPPTVSSPDCSLRVRVLLARVDGTDTASIIFTVLGGMPSGTLALWVGDRHQMFVGFGDTYRGAVPLSQVAAVRFQI